MHQVMLSLGCERYGAQGGDWGAVVTSEMACSYPDHVVGLHLNMVPPWRPRWATPPDDLDPDDRAEYDANRQRGRGFSGYAAIQSTRPHTVGVALDDSPAGLAAWIIEKFREWSDSDGDVDRHFGRDHLLDNVMAYWLTGTAHSAARMYLEATRTGAFGPPEGRVEVPTAVADFPAEPVRPVRRWAEERYRIERWTRMPRGGHFAAMEQPELFAADVRAFFTDLA